MADKQRNSKQNIEGKYLRSGDTKNTEQVSFKISVPDVEYKQLTKGEINFAFEATGVQIALTGTFYPSNIFSKKNFGIEKWVLSKGDQAHLKPENEDKINGQSNGGASGISAAPKPVIPEQSPQEYNNFNNNSTAINQQGIIKENDASQVANENFIKATPDNEFEANYFTVDIDGEKLKITSTGKASIKSNSGKTYNASVNIKTGNAITNLYVMKYTTDIILGYEESDGEDTYTYIARLSFATGRVKWKTNVPGFNLKVSSGSKQEQPLIYITTYSFVGKLNLDTGKLIK
ncbi:MAG: hypothetical protein QM768_20920 [Agriterribacter sp.]